MVTDASMTMACNLQLARRNMTLKQCAARLHEHDRTCLRRSGFMSGDLFSSAILNAVEKKREKERSSKRQKLDMKPIFLSKKSQHSSNSHSYGSSYAQNSGKSSFHDFKGQQQQQQQKSAQSPRGGRGGRRK